MEMRDERAGAVVAKGVYAYAHTFWDNDDDDEDGERESKEERRNRMNGKGEGERDCFCIDEIWGYEDATRPRRELLCIRGLQCSLSRPNCLHTHTHTQAACTACAGNVRQNWHESEAA